MIYLTTLIQKFEINTVEAAVLKNEKEDND